MASSQNMYNHNGPIPRPNVQMLGESLRNGQLDLPTAIGQLGLFFRETLKAIEDHADEQGRLSLEQKLKTDKMDKIINDLSEKCQGLQQALLYKEEKYDEKCREAERYKVICELSAKAAVDDNSAFYTPSGELNNNFDANGYGDGRDERHERKDGVIKMEEPSRESCVDESKRLKPSLKTHVKLSQSQMHLVDVVEPFQSSSPRFYEGLPVTHYGDDNHSTISHYYAGGPCRRKIPIDRTRILRNSESKTRERLEGIGGINIRGPTVNSGPVVSDRLIYKRTSSLYNEDDNRKVKVDLTSQRNEMMSSSGSAAQSMKQKCVEKDLHKQVAGGSWTRLASRRKKDWPF